MKFKIEKYILKKAEELAFIRIKHDGEFSLEGYSIPKEGLDVPIKNEVLVKNIKTGAANDGLNPMSIADAMVYIIGIDSQFKYIDEYKKFLSALETKLKLNINEYMGYMSRKNFEAGEFTDALIYLKALITFDNKNVDGLYHYSLVCQELAKSYQKDMDEKAMNAFLLEALDKLEEVINLDESFSLAYYHLGYHYQNQNQFVKAKVIWEEALRLGLDEDTTAEVQEQLGKLVNKVQYEEGYNLIFQGRASEGLEKLEPLLDEYPDWWNLLFMIGLGYKELGQIGDAIKYFEKILITNPKQVDAIVELGLCDAIQGDLNKAVDRFEEALKIKEDPEILCNLGMAYLNIGNLDDAIYHIERAYELNPEDEVTVACLNELNKYR